jgi:soluble lytic murein transglycosylase-like protein/tetratricopeptide (TPR) repeat protein
MSSDRHSRAMNIGIATFIAFAVTVPELAAQHFRRINAGLGSAPFTDQDLRTIDDKLKLPGVIHTSASVFDLAIEESRARAQATHFESALEKARQFHFDGKYADARTLARAIVLELDTQPESPSLAPSRDQALLLLARAELDLDEAPAALRHLNMITRDTPVDDFLLWMKADSMVHMNNPAEAAAVLQVVVKQNTILKPRAMAARARALFAAQDWENAAPELAQVNRDFTLHPQRHELLYEEAFALEKLGKKQEAADVYLNAWFEFPYHAAGDNAQLRLDALQAEGVMPSRMIPAQVLYDRFVQLRINKHWDVAERLFKELLVDNVTPNMDSAFEHDVIMQLALNDWGRRRFEDALTRLLQLADAWEKGERAGISKKYVWRYIRKSYSQLGQLDKALAALEVENSGASMRSRLIERAELLEDHARYEDAFKIYEAITSGANKRGWHYTWLLYKTGRFEQAYENFTDMANRSSGERRARNLYWAARTLENDNRNDEAIEVWQQVYSGWRSSYYAIQSANRILDVQQRESVDGAMLAQVVDLAAAGDVAIDAIEAAESSNSVLSWASIEDPRIALRLDREDVIMSSPDELPQGESASVLAVAAMDRVLSTPISMTDVMGSQDIAERDGDSANDVSEPITPLKVPKAKLAKMSSMRVSYTTSGRMYWNGRLGSTTSFARYREGELIGPLPATPVAYDETTYIGGLTRAAATAGEVFPNLERAKWLWNAGMEKQARWLVRDVAIEFRELSRRYRPSARPHALDNGRWNYYIDNRRKDRSGLWGWKVDEARFPVPDKADGKKALVVRQQAIYDQKNELREVLLDAFKEVGDHFMARKYTTEKGGWYREDPNGPARTMWMQAYPRAFPNIVLREAHKNGVNPYLIWALMTVESSYNPDSVSPAQALGLLQVIPKTGLKTALMLGDEDFGPQDLVDEEVAIAHGAFYFSQLLRKFRGQELLAFAGYNGGPHRVGDWLDSRGNQPLDEFIEEIPYDEARGYAKKVAKFVALFLKLYEQQDTLYIGQNLRSDYRAEPRF